MPAVPETCPYCNSRLPTGLAVTPGRGVLCPRCQEVIPHTEPAGGSVKSPEPTELVPAGSTKSKPLPVARMVLGLMLVMATLAFIFIWNTTPERRSRDRMADQTDPETLHSIVLAPSALPALGYLPADVNAIVGLHAAECNEQEDGRRFLFALQSLPIMPAGPRFEALIGLPWNQIDHAVLGVRVEDQLVPRFTLVVRSRQTINQAALLKTLKAQHKDRGKRSLYTFPLEGFQVDATCWIPDDHTLVISRSPEDFDPAPMTSSPGIDRFNADLQQIFRDSLPTGVVVWLAAATRNGEQILAPLSQFGAITRSDVEIFAPLQRVGLWMRAENKLETAAVADLRDESAATRLKAYLSSVGLASEKVPPELEANPQTQRLASQLKKSLSVEQKDSHLSLRASCSMDAFLEAVAK